MKRFLYLILSVSAFAVFTSTPLGAAAKKPGLFASLNPFRTKTAEEIEEAQKKADKKLHKKHHSIQLYRKNMTYQKACRDYNGSKIRLKSTESFGHPITCAMLRAHLATIAAYRDTIAALPEDDRPIANHRYRKLLADNARTVQALAEREPIEAAEVAARERKSAAAKTKARTEALEFLEFDRTATPSVAEIRAHHARLYRENAGNTAMLQNLNAAKALLTPAADGANEIDDDFAF